MQICSTRYFFASCLSLVVDGVDEFLSGKLGVEILRGIKEWNHMGLPIGELAVLRVWLAPRESSQPAYFHIQT